MTESALGPREPTPRVGPYTEHSLLGAAAPSGSLSTALADLMRRGFTEDFTVEGTRLRGRRSGRIFEPEDLVIREHHRFEGMSDPDDMAIVYALEGPGGVRGVLVDAFGVYANPAVSAVVSRIPVSPTVSGSDAASEAA